MSGSTARQVSVGVGPLQLANPVMPASGCFGPQLGQLIPLHRLGAVVTKTVFASARSGNPAHRLTETPNGMLNAVGIPSLGARGFIDEILPSYLASGAPVIVSIGGLTVEEYWTVAEELSDIECSALEVNVSCPNLEHGGLEIGAEPTQVEAVVRGIVERTELPVIVKLTPNVTRIDEIARASEAAGAAALTVANTFVGLAVDIRTRRPVLGNGTGGVSGPAIKPLALALVKEAVEAVNIPVIGCGGITTAEDVVEFLITGASAVQVGTANFAHPDVMIRIIDVLPTVLERLGVNALDELVGTLVVEGSRSPQMITDQAVREPLNGAGNARHGQEVPDELDPVQRHHERGANDR